MEFRHVPMTHSHQDFFDSPTNRKISILCQDKKHIVSFVAVGFKLNVQQNPIKVSLEI